MSATILASEMRASSVKDCARKAVYQATGAPRRERTEREDRWLFRGRSLGRDYVQWLTLQHGEGAVDAEIPIEWGDGYTGHADAYVKPTRTLFEVLSSAHASDQLIRSKLLQLTLYLEHFDKAERGVLVILDPSTFEEDRVPVLRDTPAYKELVEEVRARIAEIDRWRETGELPARVCSKPTDAIGHFCRHVEWCFQGWEADPLPSLEGANARTVLTAYYQAKQAEDAAKAPYERAKAARRDLEDDLAELVPVGTFQVGPLKITRTHVERRPTVDYRKCELAGFPVPEEFLKAGSAYDTFKVERVTDEPLLTADDFDQEEPF